MTAEQHSRPLRTADQVVRQRVKHATDVLTHAGILGGPKDKKLSVRVESRLLEAARGRCGINEDSALVAAGLALLAGENNFGLWLSSHKGMLSDDFEIGL